MHKQPRLIREMEVEDRYCNRAIAEILLMTRVMFAMLLIGLGAVMYTYYNDSAWIFTENDPDFIIEFDRKSESEFGFSFEEEGGGSGGVSGNPLRRGYYE